MSEGSIILTKLSKQYAGSDTYALKDVSLHINAGEAYGFLGPNGAGKSTAIRTLLNFIQPTSGSATILGKDIVKDSVEIKRSVGYLSGDFAVYPKMTGRNYLKYLGELQPPHSQKYLNELIQRFKAEPSKKLGKLSRGNRQKFGIIQAFMHQPQVLILDEPTSGLDPLMQEEFYEIIAEAKARGAAIFMSSHILSEVQKVCDRVGIIREGKIVDERSMAEMNSQASQTLELHFGGVVPIVELKKIAGLKVVSSSRRAVTLHMHGNLAPLFAVLAKYQVTKLDTHEADLDELFLGFYENKGNKS